MKKTRLDVLKIRETYTDLKSIQKTAFLLGISKNTVNKYVKDLSCQDKHSRYSNTRVFQKTLDGNKVISIHKNANAAAKATGISVYTLNHCLRKRTNTAGGYLWEYENK